MDVGGALDGMLCDMPCETAGWYMRCSVAAMLRSASLSRGSSRGRLLLPCPPGCCIGGAMCGIPGGIPPGPPIMPPGGPAMCCGEMWPPLEPCGPTMGGAHRISSFATPPPGMLTPSG